MIKLVFAIAILLYSLYFYRTLPENFSDNDSKKCTEKLLPIMDPMYNMREFCKQSILLEDHLTHPKKRCKDCQRKHFMSLEALAEEACTLDKTGEYKAILTPLPDKCRELQKQLYSGGDQHAIAQECRKIRKQLMPLCYDKF